MIIGGMGTPHRHWPGTSANVPQQAGNAAYIMVAHFTSYNKCSMPCVGKTVSGLTIWGTGATYRSHQVAVVRPTHSIRASNVARNRLVNFYYKGAQRCLKVN